MRTLVSGDVWVHYSQFYVYSGEYSPELAECFGGQQNGLCGAAVPGTLFLITGLHTGDVGLDVDLHDAPPVVDESWQEIVEVSFRPAGETWLSSWGGEPSWLLDLAEGGYRVRYCATGMDEGNDQDTRVDGDPAADRCLLQLWPAPPGPDRVIKQTSEIAAYWHEFAREQPPPPTAGERAAAERLALLEREREAEQARLNAELRHWGGRLPSERLRQVGGCAVGLARLDRSLIDAVAETDPVTQREIARWVTRRAFTHSQLVDVEWIAPALAAMDRGEPLPRPFDGGKLPWDLLFSDKCVPRTAVTSLDGRHDNCRQQAMAFPGVFSAREQDPLRAALHALWSAAAAFGQTGYQVLFAEVRQAFPAVADDRI